MNDEYLNVYQQKTLILLETKNKCKKGEKKNTLIES